MFVSHADGKRRSGLNNGIPKFGGKTRYPIPRLGSSDVGELDALDIHFNRRQTRGQGGFFSMRLAARRGVRTTARSSHGISKRLAFCKNEILIQEIVPGMAITHFHPAMFSRRIQLEVWKLRLDVSIHRVWSCGNYVETIDLPEVERDIKFLRAINYYVLQR